MNVGFVLSLEVAVQVNLQQGVKIQKEMEEERNKDTRNACYVPGMGVGLLPTLLFDLHHSAMWQVQRKLSSE